MLIEILRHSDFCRDIEGRERRPFPHPDARIMRRPDSGGIRRWYLQLGSLEDLPDLLRSIVLPVEINAPDESIFDLRLVIRDD